MRLSIVTTMYRSARFLAEFHARAEAARADSASSPSLSMSMTGRPTTRLDKALSAGTTPTSAWLTVEELATTPP